MPGGKRFKDLKDIFNKNKRFLQIITNKNKCVKMVVDRWVEGGARQ